MLLSPKLSARWSEWYGRVPGEAFFNLEVCSDTLSKIYKEKEIDEKELKKLKDDIGKLYEKVYASTSLNEYLRTLILDQLELIRRAILEYRIRGVTGLRESLTTSLGEVHLNMPLFNQASRETEEVKGFLKVLSVIHRLTQKTYEKSIEYGVDKIFGLLP